MKQYRKPVLGYANGDRIAAIPAILAAAAGAAAAAAVKSMFDEGISNQHDPSSEGLRSIENY